MKKQKNKKSIFIIIFLSALIILLGIIVVFVEKSIRLKTHDQYIGEQTDVDVIEKIFPGLEGIDKVSWEISNFSYDSRRIGPTELQFKGKIFIEENTANKYKVDYDWQEVSIDFSTNYIDVTEYQKDVWYYSDSFNKTVLSNTMMGKIYFNGKDMWFEASQY